MTDRWLTNDNNNFFPDLSPPPPLRLHPDHERRGQAAEVQQEQKGLEPDRKTQERQVQLRPEQGPALAAAAAGRSAQSPSPAWPPSALLPAQPRCAAVAASAAAAAA